MAEWKPRLLRFVEGGEGKFPGGKFQLPPMNSFQRRVVHALAEECGLQHTSVGVGEGKAKCIVVRLSSGGGLVQAAAGGKEKEPSATSSEPEAEGAPAAPAAAPAAAPTAAAGGSSTVLRDLVKFEMCLEGQYSKHPDPEYTAFRKMDGATISGWDGDCDVIAVKAQGRSLSEWASVQPMEDEGECSQEETDAELLGAVPAKVVADLVDGYGGEITCISDVPVLMTDGIEEVMRKVEEGRARFEAEPDEYTAFLPDVAGRTWEALFSLVRKFGSLGEATMPDGSATVRYASGKNGLAAKLTFVSRCHCYLLSTRVQTHEW